jgi:hypothetical protein
MIFYDAGKISSRKKTPEGYLVVDALAGRAGVQEYSPLDLGDGVPGALKGLKKIRLLRPESEALSPESVASFKSKPVTIGHPPKLLTNATVKQHQMGMIEDIFVDGPDIKARLIVQDATAISAIGAGMEQVSLGYNADIKWGAGVDDLHGAYDGRIENILGNHLAIVDGVTFSGRAGSKYRLLDAAEKQQETIMSTEIMDALAAENKTLKMAVNDAKEELIGFKQQIMDSEKKLAKVAAELETTKKAVVTDAEINERINEGVKSLVTVIDAARTICPDMETDGKSVTEIQLGIIEHLTGGQSKPDAGNPALVASVFDAVRNVSVSKTKQINDALAAGGDNKNPVDKSREMMIARRSGKQE